MRITVRLFAALRERAGWSHQELDLPAGAVVADVWPALGLGEEPPGLAYARNREYAVRDAPIEEDDEVAVIPPVSGGAFVLRDEPLSVEAAIDEVASDEAGAVATFIGTTRVHSRGRMVTHLEYEAYEGMAEAELERIAGELEQRHSLIAVAMGRRAGC